MPSLTNPGGHAAASTALPKRLGVAALMVVVQLLLLWISSATRLPFRIFWKQLFAWDSGHYQGTLRGGMWNLPTHNSEAAFFPGYPMVASVLTSIGVNPADALRVTAIAADFAFWFAFLTILSRLDLRRMTTVSICATIACYPVGFVMVCAYSESTCCCLLVAYAYFLLFAKPRSTTLAGAALCGFLLSLTRLVGVAASVLPLVLAWCEWRKDRNQALAGRLRRALPLANVALATWAGTLAFFVFCQARLGQWDIYMFRQTFSWRHSPDMGAPFDISVYWPLWLTAARLLHWPLERNVIALLVLWAAIGTTTILSLLDIHLARTSPSTDRFRRLGLYLFSTIALFLAVSAMGREEHLSFERYALPIWVALLIALADWIHKSSMARRAEPMLAAGLGVVSLVNLHVQGGIGLRFLAGSWVP